MDVSNFSVEFLLNRNEIQKLNKMYLKVLYKERVLTFLGLIFFFSLCSIFFLTNEDDLDIWIIQKLASGIVFFMFGYLFVNLICILIFKLTKKLLRFDNFLMKYKFSFTNSFIYIRSPLGKFVHNWTQIEKGILTKDFLILYVKEKNGYIISISNKNHHSEVKALVAFIDNNVIKVTRV